MSIKNPFRAWREATGLTRIQVGAALDVSYERLSALEAGRGKSIPEAWFPGLRLLGADPEQIAKDYRAYRQAIAASVGAPLVGG